MSELALPGVLSGKREKQIMLIGAVLSVLAFAYLMMQRRKGSASVSSGDATGTQIPSGVGSLNPYGNVGGSNFQNPVFPTTEHISPLASLEIKLGLSNAQYASANGTSTDTHASSTGLSIFGINIGGLGFKQGNTSGSQSQFSGAYSNQSGLSEDIGGTNLTGDQVTQILAFANKENQLYFNNVPPPASDPNTPITYGGAWTNNPSNWAPANRPVTSRIPSVGRT